MIQDIANKLDLANHRADATPEKVAGGIDTMAEVRAFLDAGVHRIGTSKAVEIMEQTSP